MTRKTKAAAKPATRPTVKVEFVLLHRGFEMARRASFDACEKLAMRYGGRPNDYTIKRVESAL